MASRSNGTDLAVTCTFACLGGSRPPGGRCCADDDSAAAPGVIRTGECRHRRLGQALLAGLHGMAGWSPVEGAGVCAGRHRGGVRVLSALRLAGSGAGDLARTFRLFVLRNVVGVVVSTVVVRYAGLLAADEALPGIVRMLAVNVASIGSYAGIWVARFLLLERITAVSAVEGLFPSP